MENNRRKAAPWRGVLIRLPFVLLLPLGLLLPRFCSGRADLVERVYAARLYPVIATAVSTVTSLVPFSLAELLLYTALLAIPALSVFMVIRCIRRKQLARLVSYALSLCIAAGVMLCLFYVTWGFTYFRTPLALRLGLDVQARSVEELQTVTAELAHTAAALREEAGEDADGVFAPKARLGGELDTALPAAYAALCREYGAFSGRVTRAKPVLWSRGLSWAGIAGIYIGFTAEPNVNVDQPPLLLAAGTAHEMAHQLGVASEDAAEFTAYLACRSAGDPEIAYSGVMLALIHCSNALNGADRDAYLEVASVYSDAMWRDIGDYNAYWDAFEGPVEEHASAVNDGYLKHNAQESGVKSYGEMVDLMLAWHAQTNS